jgi:hypothetical protein
MGKVEDKIKQYKMGAESDDQGVVRYLLNHQTKSPTAGIQYVGIEVECFAKMNRISLQKLFFKYDLEAYLMIGSDSSIRPPDDDQIYHAFELRLLIPQGELSATLKRIGKVFRLARLKTNESCGLHVHLDMRQRNPSECFDKLLNFQDVLFALVNKDRWNNEYCRQTARDDIDHHMGINYARAFAAHRTIEVRMHHGCVDCNQIEKWVRLLLNVIQGKNAPEVISKKTVLKWKGLNKKLRHYVRRNFKDEWFDEKEGFEY